MTEKFRILVAEDEPIMRQSIVTKLGSADPRFEVIGAAQNGSEALDMCRALMPDVLFADVRMPVLNGLDLIREAKQIQPGLLSFVVSAYDDFVYAQQAISLDVSGYILKPVRAEDLAGALDRAAEELEIAREQYEADVLSGVVDEPDRHNASSYLPVAVCLGNLLPAGRVDTATGFRDAVNGLTDWGPHICSRVGWVDRVRVMHLPVANQQIFLLSGPRHEAADVDACMRVIHERLAITVPGVPVTTVGVPIPVSLDRVRASVQVLRDTLEERLIPCEANRFVAGEPSRRSHKAPDGKLIDQAREFCAIGDQSAVRAIVTRFIALLKRESVPQRIVERELVSLVEVIQNPEPSGDAALPGTELVRQIGDTQTWEELEPLLEATFDLVIGRNVVCGGPEGLSDRIATFIEDNLTQELTMATISARLNYSVAHLSRVFRKYRGVSPIQYLSRLRVERAAAILVHHPSVAIHDVAVMVGFRDQYYFSRVFRHHTGCSPSEHRKRTRPDPS